jgi:hypothetical protein
MAPNMVIASTTSSGSGPNATIGRRGDGCWAGACDIARTASQAAAVASSLCTNSCAALCCNAWNAPIGRPNCSRTFR